MIKQQQQVNYLYQQLRLIIRNLLALGESRQQSDKGDTAFSRSSGQSRNIFIAWGIQKFCNGRAKAEKFTYKSWLSSFINEKNFALRIIWISVNSFDIRKYSKF